MRQRRITKCDSFRDYKVRQSWITNCNRFWITKCDKNLRNVLQSAMGLQSTTDYKVIQYKRRAFLLQLLLQPQAYLHGFLLIFFFNVRSFCLIISWSFAFNFCSTRLFIYMKMDFQTFH